MITFIYSSKGEGEAYILTRQIHAVLHSYENLAQVSLGGIISHHHIMLTGLFPSLFNGSMLWKLQTIFIFFTTDKNVIKSPH